MNVYHTAMTYHANSRRHSQKLQNKRPFGGTLAGFVTFFYTFTETS